MLTAFVLIMVGFMFIATTVANLADPTIRRPEFVIFSLVGGVIMETAGQQYGWYTVAHYDHWAIVIGTILFYASGLQCMMMLGRLWVNDRYPERVTSTAQLHRMAPSHQPRVIDLAADRHGTWVPQGWESVDT